MPRNLYNWSYRDVTRFLKEHEFEFLESKRGSHELWRKLGENRIGERVVEVNFTHTSYPPKTLKTMIHQSGIAKEVWIKWAGGKRK